MSSSGLIQPLSLPSALLFRVPTKRAPEKTFHLLDKTDVVTLQQQMADLLYRMDALEQRTDALEQRVQNSMSNNNNNNNNNINLLDTMNALLDERAVHEAEQNAEIRRIDGFVQEIATRQAQQQQNIYQLQGFTTYYGYGGSPVEPLQEETTNFNNDMMMMDEVVLDVSEPVVTSEPAEPAVVEAPIVVVEATEPTVTNNNEDDSTASFATFIVSE